MFQSQSEDIQSFINYIISFSTFIMITAILGCVCGCRNKVDKDDWMGKEGKMKRLPTGLSPEDDRVLRVSSDQTKNVANRASTANRSLPDIPTNELRETDPPWDTNQLTTTSDNCSELYATVGDAPNPTDASKSKKRQAPSAPSTENSQSEATPPHQYAKLSHPYARVKPPPPKTEVPHHASSSTVTQPSIELESSETTPGVQGGSETTLSSSPDQPVPPPRARRSSSQSNLYRPSSSPAGHRNSNTLPSTSSSSSSRVSDTIAAAPAISGQISASQELPYITLPLPESSTRHNSVPADLPTRTLESGGPHAIRSPDIRGGGVGVEESVTDAPQGNFSGDSQDSSKGYTSISVREPLASIRAQTSHQQTLLQRRMDPHYATVSDDSDEMYAAIEDRSGSDTYAQIIPPPPSVDSLRTRVAENHSRQASSSSATSSTVAANVGSPKPEKRSANSPLPPPPPTTSPPTSPAPAPPTMSLEDMYAKVIKKKSSASSVETTPVHHPEPVPTPNPGYESLNPTISSSEPNYESVTTATTSNDPGYELVRNTSSCVDPNYEELREQASNYEMLNGEPNYEPLTSSSDDPNYESVGGFNEPPYEQLSTELSSPSTSDILYATVNKPNKKQTQ